MKKLFQSTVTVALASLCLQANANAKQDSNLPNATILQNENNVVRQVDNKMANGEYQSSDLANCEEDFMASRLLRETESLAKDATILDPYNAGGAKKMRISSQWIYLFSPGIWYRLS